MSTDDGDQGDLLPMEVEWRPDQFDAIEEMATRAGVDRSVIVRRMFDLGYAQYRQAETPNDDTEGQQGHA